MLPLVILVLTCYITVKFKFRFSNKGTLVELEAFVSQDPQPAETFVHFPELFGHSANTYTYTLVAYGVSRKGHLQNKEVIVQKRVAKR